MQLVMFSGNSLRNRDWVYETKEQFADLFDSFYVQRYRHWDLGTDWIDLPHELQILRQQQTSFRPGYGVFAKSIGTVLAVQAIGQQIIKPEWLLFCGLPLDYTLEEFPQFAAVLAKCGLPVVFVHNQHDPVGDAAAAKAYLNPKLANTKNWQFIETPGDTHDYEDYDLLRAQLKELRG
ncbi:MAG TPA: hypothetical protein VGG13_01655 [Candidatus Saccharimonadales bacterium]|jgi:hypothetical protein